MSALVWRLILTAIAFAVLAVVAGVLLGWRVTYNILSDDLGLPGVAKVVQNFGIQYHFESITRGVIDTRDMIYAVSMTAFFLFLNVLVIERRR